MCSAACGLQLHLLQAEKHDLPLSIHLAALPLAVSSNGMHVLEQSSGLPTLRPRATIRRLVFCSWPVPLGVSTYLMLVVSLPYLLVAVLDLRVLVAPLALHDRDTVTTGIAHESRVDCPPLDIAPGLHPLLLSHLDRRLDRLRYIDGQPLLSREALAMPLLALVLC